MSAARCQADKALYATAHWQSEESPLVYWRRFSYVRHRTDISAMKGHNLVMPATICSLTMVARYTAMKGSIQYKKQKRGTGLCLSIAAIALLALTACASPPEPPAQELQAAESAITNAEQARVADYASPELGEARDKLAAARKAVNEENMVLAKRLAEQALLDADLATARAAVAKARVVNDEMKQSTETIKQEMQRNPGAQP